MANSDLHGIHQRLIISDPRAAMAPHSPRAPGFGLRFLTGMLLVPLGMAARIVAQIYLEITPEAVHFQSVLAFVAITHLVLVAATVLAVLGYRRRPLLVVVTLQMWIGYGVGAALLVLKDV